MSEALRAEVERLRMVNAELERALDDERALRRREDAEKLLRFKFGLTSMEARLVLALHAAYPRQMKAPAIMDMFYGHKDDEPGAKIIQVRVCTTRKKIGCVDNRYIDNVYAEGYFLTQAGAVLISDALGALERPR